MKKTIILLVLVLMANVISAITVDGYAFLNNQSNHGGIEVLFDRTVPSNLIVTAYTNSNGYYTAELENGIYDITYSKSDFHTFYLYDEILYANTTFNNITLPEIPGIINVPSFYPYIQFAINESVNGDTILVETGTYNENINYIGKNITVASLFLTTQDTSYISSTIIDGNENGSVVTFESSEDSTAALCGFTITNGLALGFSPYNNGGGIHCNESSPSLQYVTITGNSADDGGGIYCNNSNPILNEVTILDNYSEDDGGGICCYDYSSPSLVNVTISNNSAEVRGGGICCKFDSSPSLTNAIISNNSSSFRGGGIFCNESSPNLVNVTIADNTASDNGGGIYCEHYSSPSLTNAIISNNSTSSNGGGIYCESNSSPSLTNAIISNNSTSSNGGGIYYNNSSPSLTNATISNNSAEGSGGGIYCEDSSPIITNCIVSNNTGYYGLFVNSGFPIINYSDFYNNDNGNFFGCEQWIGFNVTTNVNGDSCDAYYNIQMEPCFVSPSNGNYNLLANSPCIDAGIPDTTGLNLPPWDIIGNLRIWDGDGNGSTIIDMGAYEYGAPPYVDVDDNVIVQTPEVFLLQNYPNPFNPETTISYQLPEDSEVELIIYNIKGQKVKTLLKEILRAGEHSIIWDGRDSNGKRVSSGIYFYKLEAGDFQKIKKMVLLK